MFRVEPNLIWVELVRSCLNLGLVEFRGSVRKYILLSVPHHNQHPPHLPHLFCLITYHTSPPDLDQGVVQLKPPTSSNASSSSSSSSQSLFSHLSCHVVPMTPHQTSTTSSVIITPANNKFLSLPTA